MVHDLQRKFIKTTMLVVTILLIAFLAVMNIVNDMLSRRESISALDELMARSVSQMPGQLAEGRGPEPAPDSAPREAAAPEEFVPAPDSAPREAAAPERPDGQEFNPGLYFVAHADSGGAVTFSDLTHAGDLEWSVMIALLQQAGAFGIEVTGETETETMRGYVAEAPGNDPQAPGEEPDGVQAEVPGEKAQAPGKEPGGVPGTAESSVTGRAGSYMYRADRMEDGSVVYVFLDVTLQMNAAVRILLVTAAVGAAAWILILLLVIYLSGRAIAPVAESIENQRRFITDAGHELKTPVAVILANVDAQELHEGKTKWLENIRAQSLRLSDLTRQLLILSRMEETGTKKAVSTHIDISMLLQETVRAFYESASARGMRIQTQIEPDVRILFSQEQFRQMTELLMDNAVKYGKENGEISVSLERERHCVRMTFGNDCEELPDVDPDRLFERFYRADTSRSRQTGGSGIGLAVVRAIAVQNGGKAYARFTEDARIEFVIELVRK